jgi:hypothetical protein
MSDPSVRLALRVHDECNGSDVFGSDICTCRPYLIFGVEEAVKEAQKGGSGVVIYFRKEGRALGEVTKYLVYNARKYKEHSANTTTEPRTDLYQGSAGLIVRPRRCYIVLYIAYVNPQVRVNISNELRISRGSR